MTKVIVDGAQPHDVVWMLGIIFGQGHVIDLDLIIRLGVIE